MSAGTSASTKSLSCRKIGDGSIRQRTVADRTVPNFYGSPQQCLTAVVSSFAVIPVIQGLIPVIAFVGRVVRSCEVDSTD